MIGIGGVVTKITVCFAVLLLPPSDVVALPTQPGSCASPNPLAGSTHVASNAEGNGTLLDAGITIVIAGDGVSGDGNLVAGTPFEMTLNTGNFITMSTFDDVGFRGFLLKMTDGDLEDTLGILAPFDDAEDVQILDTCTTLGASSLAHTNNTEKTQINANIGVSVEDGDPNPTENQPLTLEVTVVLSNNAEDGSVWYSDTFQIVTTATAAETSSSPSTMTDDEGSESPVMAPGSSSPSTTMDGSESPVMAPGSSSPSATMDGSESPVMAPGSLSPVVEESLSPATEESLSPVMAPPFPICYVCNNDPEQSVTMPDIRIPLADNVTCAQIEFGGLSGQIEPPDCAQVGFIMGPCECAPKEMSASPMMTMASSSPSGMPSAEPMMTEEPSSSPSSSPSTMAPDTPEPTTASPTASDASTIHHFGFMTIIIGNLMMMMIS